MLILRTKLFLFCILMIVFCGQAFAQGGIVTWLEWQNSDPPYVIDSAYKGVTAKVTLSSDGSPLDTVQALTTAGWQVIGNAIETPQRSGGSSVTVRISGLPTGAQEVYIRLHTGPRPPGNEWWYQLEVEMPGAIGGGDMRLVSGKGGYDTTSMYERKMGTLGTSEKPVNEVTLSFHRYEWTQMSRAGAIRVETTPSMDTSHTAEPTLENDAARAELMKGVVKDASGAVAYACRVIPGVLKVRPKFFDALNGIVTEDAVRIVSARGEYENRQILLYSNSQDLKDVVVTASDLTGKTGTIPASNIMACPVGYIRNALPYDLVANGYWPDPILDFLKSFNVNKDDLQSVWYRAFVPYGTKPGVYKGSVTVKPSNAPEVVVAVELRVRDFDVPKMSHLRMVVGPSSGDDFERSYKINPGIIYSFVDGLEKQFPKWAEQGATAVNIDYFAGGDGEDVANKLPSDAQLERLCDEYGARLKALEAVGLRDKAYFYCFDEAGDQWHPAMRKFCDVIKSHFPDLKIMTTAHDPTNNTDYTTGSGKPAGSWTGASIGLEKIDIWVPMIFHYDYQRAMEARKLGRQVWWYTCNTPGKPYPGIMLKHTAMDSRMLMGFMAFAFQTDGFLYYTTHIGEWYTQAPITSGPYTPWTTEALGDAFLYEKGPNDTSLPSIRMEMIRDGMEDYDYLWMARELAKRPKVKASKDPLLVSGIKLVESLSAPGNDLTTNLTNYTQDTAKLEQTRARIADFIEKAQSLGGGVVK